MTPGSATDMTPDLSIIIVNWNSANFVKKCLATVYRQTRGVRFEVIVVDSASFDGCGEMLAREFPAVIFLQSARNIGFGRANNLGMERARAATLLFLNPDTEVAGPALDILLAELHNLPGAGSVGAKLLNSDGSVQTSCIQATPTILNQALDSAFLQRLFPKAGLWGMRALSTAGDRAVEVEMLSGACIMAKRKVIEEVRGFSPDFYMYCEDADLCHKIQQAGYRNYYVPRAEVIHHGGGSAKQSRSQFSNVMMRQSVWLFFLKTRGPLYGFGYRLAMLASALGRLLLTALAAPFRLARGQGRQVGHSAQKWLAILGWSLGAQSWVKKHD